MSNSQLNKLKSGMKNGTKVTLKISLNVVGDSNDENNIPHKLILTNTQILRLRKAFANNYSANVKLSKNQFHKIGQSGGFLGRLLEPLLKTGLPSMKNGLKPLAKCVSIQLGLAAASATDAAIHKKMFGSGVTTLIISSEKMNNIMKIVKYFEESGLLIKGVRKTIKNEAKEQKQEFLGILSDILSATLLKNLLTGRDTVRAGKETIRAGQNF